MGNDRNFRVQSKYDALMIDGKHGHYEALFKIVNDEVAIIDKNNKILKDALNDLLTDCINFDGGKLSDCYLKKASDALKVNYEI